MDYKYNILFSLKKKKIYLNLPKVTKFVFIPSPY